MNTENDVIPEQNTLHLLSFISIMMLSILGCWLTFGRVQTVGLSLFLVIGLAILMTLKKIHHKSLNLADFRFVLLTMIFCCGLMLRDSNILYCLNLLALITIAQWAYAQRFHSGFPLLTLQAWVATFLRLLGNCLASPLFNLIDLHHISWFHNRSGLWKNIAIGLIWALPLLFLFGTLLVSADARFSNFVEYIFIFDFTFIGNHIGKFLICWIASAGLIHLTLVKHAAIEKPTKTESKIHWNAIQVIVVLSCLASLFLSYLCVQSTYFFGDDSFVINTRAMTYSSYAVGGFWELIWVALGSMIVLISSIWAVRNEPIALRQWVYYLSYLLLILNVILLFSAALRMTLYVQAYDLSPLRFYASTILFYILIILGLLAWRIHHQKLQFLTWDATRLALAFIVCLNLVNPNQIIAHYNLRDSSLTVASERLLFDLGKDAIPALVSHATTQPGAACDLKRRLAQKIGYQPNWRNWTWADSRARSTLQAWTIPNCSQN